MWIGLLSGAIGAGVLTALHQGLRRVTPDAPRMDTLGRRAIGRIADRAGADAPSGARLQALALAGDVVANSLYFGQVARGTPRHALRCGLLLGASAGAGALLLPGPLGLGERPAARSARTGAMTFLLYVAGGVAAAAAYRLLADDDTVQEELNAVSDVM